MIFVALLLVAAVLGAIELIRSHGQDLCAWAVLVLSLAMLIDKGIV